MGPEVGAEFGGYRIDGVLGRGGMGVVFRAWQWRMSRAVALKVLPPEFAADPGYRERFGREAAALARLDSPHVVAVFDHGAVDGSLYLAMQLVNGPDLATVLKAGPLPPARALTIVDQVAAALGDAHAVGVVHRDVKTSNVLLRPLAEHHDADHAYLCDFGIARSAEVAGSETSGLIGTVGYLAPERLRGEPATPAADVYALGCLLWAALTGKVPFTGTQAAVITAHLHAQSPRLVADDARTDALNSLLAGMLAKDPATRPTVRDVRARIREIQRDAPSQAVPAVQTGRGRFRAGARRAVQGRWTKIAIAVAAVAALGIGAALILRPEGASPTDRVARSTPAGLTCTPVSSTNQEVRAQVVCAPGPDVGDLRIAALDDPTAAADYLRTAGGADPAGLSPGRCPTDLPTRETWKRDGHHGTLVCVVLGDNTRYAWTDETQSTVSILDGRPTVSYPRDSDPVADFFTAMRFG
ncbi:serine/threonine-protein kinase [Actinokineospora sp. NBRC 105648]|uniref:serine/threonine-protein kinase n=1 Tax=Actinokineospora sp. NBRC 105648 TaxID=3032206 RepID=UPI0024A3A2DA|nr:serine/threonine-protein kinase [Actinokineospora sp. NBRC 105648]GLZ41982.1 hypothetical protein Acsp05_56060 [Actinokineospora sp. NBRC 105648]